MIEMTLKPMYLEKLTGIYRDRLQRDIPLSRFTAARIGGKADALIEVNQIRDLVEIVQYCWKSQVPFAILGGGSNLLVSDAGYRGLVILNRARQVRFIEDEEPPRVWAESGAYFGVVARMAAQRGLGGLEWASGIPGTVGGAVFGNAGAHGSDMSAPVLVAEILHRFNDQSTSQVEEWAVERMEYAYRSSKLKREPGNCAVLSATLNLTRSLPQLVQAKIDELVAIRRRTQPPGASLGSMFKNPPGDYAGRLIDAAGLKGKRIGDAQISTLHANFFINLGQARAADVYELIRIARQTVKEKFGVTLELEIERLGEW